MSQIYVARNTLSDVLIVSPPYLALGLIFLSGGVVAPLITAIGLRRMGGQAFTKVSAIWIVSCLIALPMLVAGAW